MNRVAGFLLLLPLSLAGPDERALVAKVTQMRKFVHEKRCGGDFCDGYLVVARDEKLEYLLVCATDYYDGDKTVPAPEKASCRAVSPGEHLARTDDEYFFFTEYNPKAKYSVYSETPLRKE